MISPLASIHPNAKLGNDVTIDPFAVIQEGVTIGDGTHIMPHAWCCRSATLAAAAAFFPAR
jgi:UDP-N-acetylglucosamine acyltransferase